MCFREPRPRKRPTHSTIFYFCTAYCRYFSVQRLVLQCRKLSYDYHYSILGLQIKKFSSHVLCSRWRPRRGSGGNWKYPHNVRLYHLLMSFLSSFIMYFPRVKKPFSIHVSNTWHYECSTDPWSTVSTAITAHVDGSVSTTTADAISVWTMMTSCLRTNSSSYTGWAKIGPFLNKKLSCRKETARRFVSLNILLSHSRSFEMTLLSSACVSPH